jgi:hypothetical protein
MDNGTYGFIYCGFTGVGIGALTVNDGVLTGSDGGNKYTGKASVDSATGEIVLDFEQHTPAGVSLVQGVMPLPWPSLRPRVIRLPANFDGKPIDHPLPPGHVTITFKRVPDEYAVYANGFTVTPI